MYFSAYVECRIVFALGPVSDDVYADDAFTALHAPLKRCPFDGGKFYKDCGSLPAVLLLDELDVVVSEVDVFHFGYIAGQFRFYGVE